MLRIYNLLYIAGPILLTYSTSPKTDVVSVIYRVVKRG